MSQMEMQFTYGKIVADEKPDPARPQSKPKTKSSSSSGGKSSAASPRIHHKTTTLTTDRYTYDVVSKLQPGKVYPVQAVNDIVSSCDVETNSHFMRRRSRLVRSQVNGGFKKIKVRSDSANAIECVLHGVGSEPDDACQFTVYVMRQSA